MKTEITLKIKAGKHSLKLNAEEARELYEELDEIFGKETVYQYWPYYTTPTRWWETFEVRNMPCTITTAGNTFETHGTDTVKLSLLQ